MISYESKGDFSKSLNYLTNLKDLNNIDFNKYGQRGVQALIRASPKDSGLMSKSWKYEVEKTNKGATIIWTNSDIENGCNVAILIQYGHATKSGTYVKGIDFINPAMKPVFDEIADDIGKEINRV